MSGCECADTAETKNACTRTRKAQHSKCPPRNQMHGGRNVVWVVSVVAWAVSITQRARRHRGPDRLCEMEGKGYGMRDCAWRYRHAKNAASLHATRGTSSNTCTPGILATSGPGAGGEARRAVFECETVGNKEPTAEGRIMLRALVKEIDVDEGHAQNDATAAVES